MTTSNPLNVTTLLTTILPDAVKHNKNFFSWYDYILFTTMLSISGVIGIYFGCCGKKQDTTKEYLLGGKNMKVVPIAISLVASHTSGITLLALPADIYVYGASYWLGCISMFILAFITVYVYLPVFYNLQLTSTYEYLGRRFDKRTRKCASFLFALALFVYLPIVIYIPALAFSAATGIDVHIITPIVCGVCIFYTTLGGLKGLVWSDTLQFSITVGAMTTIFILGLKATGGISNVWQKSVEGERLDLFEQKVCFHNFSFGLDFTKRESFWAIVVGLTIHWVAHTSVNQGCTQKFLSVSTLAESKRTLSANLNCLAGTIYEDFLKGILTRKGVNKNAGVILKVIVVLTGIISTALVYVVENLGSLLSISIGLGSVAHGPLLAMFTLGVLFPRANGKVKRPRFNLISNTILSLLGAFYGAMISMLCMGSVITTSNYYKSKNMLKYPTKPVSIDGCDFTVNATIATEFTFYDVSFDPVILLLVVFTETGFEVNAIFRISFYWYTMIGAIIGIIVGLIISYLSEKNDPPVPMKLLSPVTYPFLSEEHKNADTEYYGIREALQKVNLGETTLRNGEEKDEYVRRCL
ncbi:hypothetical protein NQ317_015255 [Molorchus minor]|uniref:Sodium-coupled monocarboxylate transporter 1 n=1 Tax=Molorchus minor TaxID=1323400 RepID=A0ABQ9IW14_9CUCU|nr:hypothetical protein NQ317_015255 [Molorchus minor]